MSNILVSANYVVKGFRFGATQQSDYDIMLEMWKCSFQKNLQHLDDIIIFTGEGGTYNIYRDIYWKIRDLYIQGHNVLWADLDMLCLGPTEIFGQYGNFMMFFNNDTHLDYSGTVPQRIWGSLLPWFMANLRYYPSGSIEDWLWKECDSLVKNWVDTWAYECIVHNYMFHSQFGSGFQKENLLRYHNPSMNFQWEGEGSIPEDSKIVHFHCTRSSARSVGKMQQMFNRYIMKGECL